MFNLDQSITEWRRQMLAAGIKTPALLDELESHLRDDVRQMSIVRMPEPDEFRPSAPLMILGVHPVILFVTRKLERRRLLRPHEPLVIVRRGVDEMPHHLFPRPLARRERPDGVGLGD